MSRDFSGRYRVVRTFSILENGQAGPPQPETFEATIALYGDGNYFTVTVPNNPAVRFGVVAPVYRRGKIVDYTLEETGPSRAINGTQIRTYTVVKRNRKGRPDVLSGVSRTAQSGNGQWLAALEQWVRLR